MRLPTALSALALTFGLAAALISQHRRTERLARELEAVRTEAGLRPETTSLIHSEEGENSDSQPRSPSASSDASVLHRLASIEETLAKLTESNEHLMNRGQLPISPEKREQLLARLADPAADTKERLQALRLLRRNNALADDAVQFALGWLNGTTNSGDRLRILQQLGGLTNAVLRDPLLAMAADDSSIELRKRALGSLRRLVDDPVVETQMWELLFKDTDEGIRRQARDVIIDGPVSEARAAALRDRAVAASSTLEERTIAWEALKASGQDNPEISATLSQLAQTTTNTRERLQLFEAFNEASDPAFIPPLVQGLQDPSPLVRARAADALSDFRSEPAVEEWYRYLAENDSDPAVRRQAMRVLNQGSRETRPGQRVPGRGRGQP